MSSSLYRTQSLQSCNGTKLVVLLSHKVQSYASLRFSRFQNVCTCKTFIGTLLQMPCYKANPYLWVDFNSRVGPHARAVKHFGRVLINHSSPWRVVEGRGAWWWLRRAPLLPMLPGIIMDLDKLEYSKSDTICLKYKFDAKSYNLKA